MKGILLGFALLLGVGYTFASVGAFVRQKLHRGSANSAPLPKQPVAIVHKPKANVANVEVRPMPIALGGTTLDDRRDVLEYQLGRARKGNAQAQYTMALRHLEGIDVPKNEDLALRYLHASRNGGEVRARDKITEVRRIKRQAALKERELREAAFLAELEKQQTL